MAVRGSTSRKGGHLCWNNQRRSSKPERGSALCRGAHCQTEIATAIESSTSSNGGPEFTRPTGFASPQPSTLAYPSPGVQAELTLGSGLPVRGDGQQASPRWGSRQELLMARGRSLVRDQDHCAIREGATRLVGRPPRCERSCGRLRTRGQWTLRVRESLRLNVA
jgi:hypothetical protein